MHASPASVVWHGPEVRSWRRFHRVVKGAGGKLLARLPDFPDAVLVAGCQRSGTTALRRALAGAEGVGDHRFGRDDELDAALLLSGYVERPFEGRACFQTTYLNDRFREYYEHEGYRLIWLIREPYSVVFSMLHNWRRGALRRLFDACGREHWQHREPESPLRSRLGPPRFEQACASYVGKTTQTLELVERLGRDRMLVVDYDEVVLRKAELLPQICRFAGLPWTDRMLDSLHGKSVQRGRRLSPHEARRVETLCLPVYQAARAVCTPLEMPERSAACGS